MWHPDETVDNDRYTIREVLGGGGFGITYTATDTANQKLVAIKILNQQTHQFSKLRKKLTAEEIRLDFDRLQQKFRQEALNLARCCQHPHIVKIYDVICHQNLWGMVMEYIEGKDLSYHLEEPRKFSEAEALKYIDEISQALEHVHQQNLLHLDVKPHNIVLRDQTGESVLIDFGLAREYNLEETLYLSTQGTFYYAPIEQYQKKGRFGPYTDIYSLAATLYHLLTGEPPAPAITHQSKSLQPPQELNSEISDRVNIAILKAMEADIKKRPQTIKEFRELLGLFKTSAPQFSNIPAVQLVIPEYDKENIFSSSSRIDLLIEDLNDNDKYEINSKYKIDELIGFGLYNYTFKGTNRSTLSTVLIKRLIFDPSSGCSSGGNWRNLFNSMKSLNHPHIVKTIDFICNQSIFYIMEYCNGGSVKNLMCKLGHPLTLEEAIPIIYQVCDGLEYAHRSGQKHLLSGGRFINGINHFALHPTNILFQDLGVEKIVKISDFGLNEEMLDRMTTYPGGCYSSIDKLGVSVCKGLDQSKFTNDHDIWSVAACLYYFLTGTYPRDVLQGDYPDDCLLHGGRFGWASNGAVDETWSKSPVIPIRNRGVNIPDRLADFIDRVLYLGEDVSKRAAQPLIFCSAIEFKQALKQTFNA